MTMSYLVMPLATCEWEWVGSGRCWLTFLQLRRFGHDCCLAASHLLLPLPEY